MKFEFQLIIGAFIALTLQTAVLANDCSETFAYGWRPTETVKVTGVRNSSAINASEGMEQTVIELQLSKSVRNRNGRLYTAEGCKPLLVCKDYLDLHTALDLPYDAPTNRLYYSHWESDPVGLSDVLRYLHQQEFPISLESYPSEHYVGVKSILQAAAVEGDETPYYIEVELDRVFDVEIQTMARFAIPVEGKWRYLSVYLERSTEGGTLSRQHLEDDTTLSTIEPETVPPTNRFIITFIEEYHDLSAEAFLQALPKARIAILGIPFRPAPSAFPDAGGKTP